MSYELCWLLINTLIITCILYLILCLYWRVRVSSVSEDFDTDVNRITCTEALCKKKSIPPIIWSYWGSTDIPEVVQLSVATWKKHNPYVSVRLLNKETYGKYLDKDIYKLRHSESETRASDFLRFALLAKYGGIWMDSTIVLHESLDWVFKLQHEYVGYFISNFTTNKQYPIIENWFMACTTDSGFMKDWSNEVASINNYESVNHYIQHVSDLSVDLQNLMAPDYLMCHAAAQVVLQAKSGYSGQYDLHLISATDPGGPFYYLQAENWNSLEAISKICRVESYRTPVLKLRGTERQVLDQNREFLRCVFP